MGMIVTVIEYAVVGTCMLSFGLALFAFVGLFRNLPSILSAARRLLGWCMLLTLRVYQPVLSFLRRPVLEHTGLDLLRPPARVGASTLLSLLLLFLLHLLHLLTGWHIGAIGLGLAVLHGLTVGSVWDSISQPDGIEIGDRLQ